MLCILSLVICLSYNLTAACAIRIKTSLQDDLHLSPWNNTRAYTITMHVSTVM